ncbi:MAG: hypothetical protein LH645_01740 [Actinomycetia bacterium]|nr:hypothetical protein [Actinomycetes bacterium]
MSSQPTQATVHEFDASTGAGSVITDQGMVIPFATGVWESGALRTMRQGQRVRVAVAGSGADAAITSLTLVTFPPTV